MADTNGVKHVAKLQPIMQEMRTERTEAKHPITDTGIGEVQAKKNVTEKQAQHVPTKEEKQAAKDKANKLKEKFPDAKSVKAKGNQVIVKTADGKKVVYTVNKNGKTTEKTTTDGDKKTTVTYAKDGTKTKTIKEGNKTTVINYDKNNKKINKTVTEGTGNDKTKTTVSYDASGNKISSVKEGTVEGKPVTVTKKYDSATGKLTQKITETNADTGVVKKDVKYTYDKNGDLISSVEASDDGTLVTTTYSDYSTQKDGSKTRNAVVVTKDAAGNETAVYKEQTLNANGKVVQSNWFSDEKHNNKTKEITYKYDKNNKKTQMNTKRYDENGNLTKEINRSNYVHTNNASTYDVETVTYQVQNDGSSEKTVTNKKNKQYFDGTIVNDNALTKLLEIFISRKKVADEAGGEDGEDAGKDASVTDADDALKPDEAEVK